MLQRLPLLLLPLLTACLALPLDKRPAGDPPPSVYPQEQTPLLFRRLKRAAEQDRWRQWDLEPRHTQFVTNSIPKTPQSSSYPTQRRYDVEYGRPYSSSNPAPRRIIYYDTLDRAGSEYRRFPSYDLAPAGATYSRDDAYASRVNSAPIAVQGKQFLPSYTIIDADPQRSYYDRYKSQPGFEYGRYRSAASDKYRQVATADNRVYQEGRSPQYYPSNGDKYYRRDRYDYPPVSRARDSLRQDDSRTNNINSIASEPVASEPNYYDPYRHYNPHQPAPWSVEIGTSLTVKDDGRHTGGKRFYVQSQREPSRYPPNLSFTRNQPEVRPLPNP